MELLTATRALLENRPRSLTLEAIAADCPDLSLAWLRTFSADRAGDYGVRKVQRLHDYLKTRSRLAA